MAELNWRNYVLEYVEEGLLDKDHLIQAFCRWCTSDEIGEMLEANELHRLDENEDDYS